MRYFFGAYDVHGDALWMQQKARKRTDDVLAFLRDIRARYPKHKRIYLVMDNLSTHTGEAIRQWCRRHRVTRVFTATYASWMNRIECHFAAFKTFVISNSDHADHVQINKAAQDYLRWRNKQKHNPRLLKAQNTIRTL